VGVAVVPAAAIDPPVVAGGIIVFRSAALGPESPQAVVHKAVSEIAMAGVVYKKEVRIRVGLSSAGLKSSDRIMAARRLLITDSTRSVTLDGQIRQKSMVRGMPS
jgi:hypothetical protein